MKTTKKKQNEKVSIPTNRKRPLNRNFGTDVDRKLGRYLQERGLPALAEILKIDK